MFAWKLMYPLTASVDVISSLSSTGIFWAMVSAIFIGDCLSSLASWKQAGDDSSPISGVGGRLYFVSGNFVPG